MGSPLSQLGELHPAVGLGRGGGNTVGELPFSLLWMTEAKVGREGAWMVIVAPRWETED